MSIIPISKPVEQAAAEGYSAGWSASLITLDAIVKELKAEQGEAISANDVISRFCDEYGKTTDVLDRFVHEYTRDPNDD